MDLSPAELPESRRAAYIPMQQQKVRNWREMGPIATGGFFAVCSAILALSHL